MKTKSLFNEDFSCNEIGASVYLKINNIIKKLYEKAVEENQNPTDLTSIIVGAAAIEQNRSILKIRRKSQKQNNNCKCKKHSERD